MERLHFSKYVLNFWFLFILFIGMLPLLLFNVSALNDLSSSLLNLNTIFLSILIEALPFVLIGILIAGFIQIFITEEHIKVDPSKSCDGCYYELFCRCIISGL